MASKPLKVPERPTAKARYVQLELPRATVLDQARAAAKVTIPGLIPDIGSSDPHDISEQPYQSIGARGVNNISAKLLLSQFPPERPFFLPEIDEDTREQLGASLSDVEDGLAKVARKALLLAETAGSRTRWMEVFRHLVVAGNILVYHPLDGSMMRLWRLDQYVVKRNAAGEMIEAVTREEVYPSELDEAVVAACELPAPEPGKTENKVERFTWIIRSGASVEHHEEINGHEVPGSRGKALADVSGWQALRWQDVPGSDYGRSYVSEYAGDFLTLEDATKAIIQFAAEASRILRVVDPNAGIDVEELARAESGDFLTGYRDKIETLQLDKSADFQVVWEVVQMIEKRLSQAFLLTANTIRNAERVTAEEIRAVAQELEDSFGGTYSVLSAEVQAPYARRLLHILAKKGLAPKLPKSVKLRIVTGFAALGANHDVAVLQDWLTDLKDLFGPQWIEQNLDGTEVAKRLGTGRGVVGLEDLIRKPQDVAADMQNNLIAQGAVRAAPQIAQGAMESINKDPNAQQPPQ